MQRRVVKINLMLLILIILLIISAIVSGIIFIPKLINKSKQNNEQTSSNSQIDENKEEKISTHTQYGDIEYTAKTNKSELGYSMKYDIDWFRIENYNTSEDCYESSRYNNLIITVSKETGDFDRRVSEIYQQNYNMPNQPTSSNDIFEYRVTDERLNDKVSHVVKKHTKTNDIIQQEYYINGKDDNFFMIRLSCPTKFETDVFPIMEEMIKTFEIL